MQRRSENPLRINHPTIAAAALALACALAPAQPVASEPLAVRAGHGPQRFLVAEPDAAASVAALDRPAERDRAGRPVAPQGGWLLTNRVVLRAADPRAVAALEPAPAGAPPRRLVGDFWVVQTSSVRAAADLADRLAADPRVAEAYIDAQPPLATRCLPDDPFFGEQWHLRNVRDPGVDANVEPAWCAGYTGAGVTIGIIDGGTFQLDHPDLAANHDPDATIETPFISGHATRVAGIAASDDGNGQGGVGVAFDAALGSMRYGTSVDTATAFLHRNDLIGVKNNSWGPPDNGRAWSMSSLERDALREAVEQGRGGLGVVFTWAAGNGGTANQPDRVDYDAYASSRYTLAIGAYDDDDDAAAINERGSSMLAVMPSRGGEVRNRGIFTTDLDSGYHPNFGGTSASAPAAAGVAALMLQANDQLGWRDVQHVIIASARVLDPSEPGWAANGAGLLFNERYGFGAVDAGAAVALAEAWVPRGPAETASTGAVPVERAIPDGDAQGIVEQVVIDAALELEHVELVFSASGTHIGDLAISIASPSGTESILAAPRVDTQTAYDDYLFTSVRHWGESAAGTWTVRVADPAAGGAHTWHGFELRLHGTPPTCPADIDGDGEVDVNDFFLYLDLFAAGDPRADFTGDGTVDVNDFFAYLDAFAAGCD